MARSTTAFVGSFSQLDPLGRQQELDRAYHLSHNDPAAGAALQDRFAPMEAFRGQLKLR
jgi:hypothetical protein